MTFDVTGGVMAAWLALRELGMPRDTELCAAGRPEH